MDYQYYYNFQSTYPHPRNEFEDYSYPMQDLNDPERNVPDDETSLTTVEQMRAKSSYFLKQDSKGNEELTKKVISAFQKNIPTEDESVVIKDIFSLFDRNGNQMAEILRGGHVKIEDGGKHYSYWKELSSARKRISSHPHKAGTDQFGIQGPWTREILFGIVEEKGQEKTFFQLERTPWAPGIQNRVGHAADAVDYFFSGKNVGPFGKSVHTDKNPIHFKY
jgi:hypothetical protein